MDDDNAAPSREDEVNLYLATLEARMEPEPFRVLAALLVRTQQLYEQDEDVVRAEVPEEDERFLTPEVMDEFLVVMAIVATGRMDQQVVDLGHGITTVVTEDIATDPARMRDLRDWAADYDQPDG